LVREAAEEGGAYFSGILTRFLDRQELKIAFDENGSRVLNEYRRQARDSPLGRKNIVDWLRLISMRAPHTIDKIPVEESAKEGPALFIHLAGSIAKDPILLAWSANHYSFVTHHMPLVQVLNRDEAVEKLADRPTQSPDTGVTILNNYGDIFSNVSDSTIVNRSKVIDSFNTINGRDGEEAAKAMVDLAGTVTAIESPAAEALFEAFRREATKPDRNHSVIKKLWVAITPLIEATGKVAELGAKLSPLWAG
jgi:hypothetical protein